MSLSNVRLRKTSKPMGSAIIVIIQKQTKNPLKSSTIEKCKIF